MKLNRAGFSATAVLIVAVLGGATGGALAMSGGQEPAPAAPTQQVQTIAEEATATPTATPTPAAVAPESVEEPVSDPAPTIEDVAKPETAQEAANRAKVEADRAKVEADRAEKVAATTAPTPAPVETSAAVPKQPMTEEEAAAKQPMVDKARAMFPTVYGTPTPTPTD